MIRSVVFALAVAALVAPAAAEASIITIEGQYGLSRPPSADLSSAISGASSVTNIAEDSLQIAGGDVLLNLGLLELGAVGDTTFGSGVSQSAIGGLFGLRLGDELRVDLLGEVGGHRYGNLLEDPSVVSGSSTNEWLMYVGLRPGVAYRFDLAAGAGIVFGVWGFARWDVTSSTVPVSVGSASSTSPGTVKLGGTTIGATLRLGIEI